MPKPQLEIITPSSDTIDQEQLAYAGVETTATRWNALLEPADVQVLQRSGETSHPYVITTAATPLYTDATEIRSTFPSGALPLFLKKKMIVLVTSVPYAHWLTLRLAAYT